MQLLVARPTPGRMAGALTPVSAGAKHAAQPFSTGSARRRTQGLNTSPRPHYVIRFDDICPTMNWAIWDRVEQVLLDNQIRPMLAVVPQNADPKLQVADPNPEFWDRARGWQHLGWDLMLHGFDHVYASPNAGLWGYDARSEFACVIFLKLRPSWPITFTAPSPKSSA